MLEDPLQPRHPRVILTVALIVFGPTKLPERGKELGEGIRGCKDAHQRRKEFTEGLSSEAPGERYSGGSDVCHASQSSDYSLDCPRLRDFGFGGHRGSILLACKEGSHG